MWNNNNISGRAVEYVSRTKLNIQLGVLYIVCVVSGCEMPTDVTQYIEIVLTLL